jgi:hypothetical protein
MGPLAFSGLSMSVSAQSQTGAGNMTGQNMTLQEEGSSAINKTVAKNKTAGGGAAPSWLATI